ncbi:transposase, IS481 family [Bordetella pertussis STO1-CHOC-0019]|nr:transposase, IS481 family [Bordetella pertussis STO1-CHOC-0019]
MNTHKHARLTFLRRLEMVQQLIAHQVCVPEAARAYGVTAPTVRKWLGRFLAQGQAGLADASSRPTVSPRAIAPAKALAIVELRRKRLTQARIAQALGVSASTVSRVLARAGLSPWRLRQPGATSIRPPAICCTSTSRSWDVSSALARSRAHTVEGPAGTSSSWPSMTSPRGLTDIPPTSASPAPSSSSRTQWDASSRRRSRPERLRRPRRWLSWSCAASG